LLSFYKGAFISPLLTPCRWELQVYDRSSRWPVAISPTVLQVLHGTWHCPGCPSLSGDLHTLSRYGL